MLESLFRQSIFRHFVLAGQSAQIVCVANGCTDRTAERAGACFREHRTGNAFRDGFTTSTAEIPERGKTNAWNKFVHELSDRHSFCLFLMDADILMLHPDTLWSMYQTLVEHPEASVSVDHPLKDIARARSPGILGRISLTTSQMTRTGTAQLTGQLYCIRTTIAHRIYLPHDLLVEDGFIKNLVCTDFLTSPSNPARVIQAKHAAHIFESYKSPRAILRNQKRQMIAQTILHVLFDQEMKRVAHDEGHDFAGYLRRRDLEQPGWLKKLVGEHVRRLKFFWEIFPGLLSFRFKRLACLRPLERLRALPAACAGFAVTLISSWMAFRFLKRGYTSYWPDTRSRSLTDSSTTPIPHQTGKPA